jgi:aryl-alcohol dehydrogenase-like predicted oxidoreductase
MDTRRIGSLQVSVIGLGCNNFGWKIDYDQTSRVVDAALDAGINFFDTADMYGNTQSEEFLGRRLGTRRDRVVIATKFGARIDDERKGARPEYIRRAAEASLRRLGTDRIDLYYLHQPDPDVPLADTLGALEELVTAGKVREIACSNFTAEMLRSANDTARGRARFTAVQNQYSLLHRDPEHDVIPECERLGIALVPYFPLASGLLTGKYRRGQPAPERSRIEAGGYFAGLLTDQKLDTVESLRSFAESNGHTLLELAFAWLLARPVVASVIAGATSPHQVTANGAAGGWHLTDSEITAVDAIVRASDAVAGISR